MLERRAPPFLSTNYVPGTIIPFGFKSLKQPHVTSSHLHRNSSYGYYQYFYFYRNGDAATGTNPVLPIDVALKVRGTGGRQWALDPDGNEALN